MSLRLARQLSLLSLSQNGESLILRRTLSTSAPRRLENQDPASALANSLDPKQTRRPPQTPLPSRTPGESATAANKPLKSFPGDAKTPPSPTDAQTKEQADQMMVHSRRWLRSAKPNRAASRKAELEQSRRQRADERAMELQMTRRWQDGDVYAPHDLSPVEMMKAKEARTNSGKSMRMRGFNTRSRRSRDVLDDLGINPINEYKNFSMMSEYMTEMGRIKGGRETGLRGVNQRKMAKAIRRAIGIGLIPSVHRHPELFEERINSR